MQKIKIAVLGAGNGACAAAADLSLAGYSVNMYEFPQFQDNIESILDQGGIELEGAGRKGFARLNKITTDIEEVLRGVQLILPIMPAYGHEAVAKICSAYLEEEQTIVLVPGSTGGSLKFARILKEERVARKIKLAETSTLPYSTRRTGPGKVRIKLVVKKFLLAAFPGRETPQVMRLFKELYPATVAATDVLEVGLNNGNPVTHAAATILNAGRIERSQGNFYLYKEAITPSVARVIEAVDRERLALLQTFGYKPWSSVERLFESGYAQTKNSLYEAYTTSEVFCGPWSSKGPTSLESRYVAEDVAYGLVSWASLGDAFDVPTPTIKSIIHLASLLNSTDYWKQGERTVEKLGISGMRPAELQRFLREGDLEES